MRSTWLIRAARSAVAGALLAATVGASVATAGPAPNRGARRRGANLFALVFGVMNVNRWFCGINNIGELCVDPTNSPMLLMPQNQRLTFMTPNTKDRKSTRLNSSHSQISYAVFCLKKKTLP